MESNPTTEPAQIQETGATDAAKEVPQKEFEDGQQAQEKDQTGLVKGMLQLEFKNVVTDLQSKKLTWADMKVPQKL